MSSHNGSTESWSVNSRILIWGLVLWVIISFAAGMFLYPTISNISFGGASLGFWFVQQGSILLLLALIFVHAMWKNRMPNRRRTDKTP